MYQCRLLALTLPTITLFFSTAAAAMSAQAAAVTTPPCPTPVRQTMPLAPIAWIESAITWPTPVHSTMASGSKPTSRTEPVW